MFRSTRAFLFFSTVLAVLYPSQAHSQQQDSPQGTASISGIVSVSGKPAATVSVILVEIDRGARTERNKRESSGTSKGPLSLKTSTDAEGRYRFVNLPAGTYRVNANSTIYASANPEANVDKSITIDEGEAREDINLALIRGGIITGKITDSDGKPIILAQIALRYLRHYGGKSEIEDPYENWGDRGHEMYQTDDRGIYRIYGLPKGRFIVGAGGESYSYRVNPAARDYTRTWFPGVTNLKQAKVLEIDEGSELTDVDIRFSDAKKTYEAAGRVIEAETGAPVTNGYVSCSKKEGDVRNEGSSTDSQGRFRLTGLTNGTYELGHSFNRDQETQLYVEGVSFVIADGNVDGLELKANRGATIGGVLVYEGHADQAVRNKLKNLGLRFEIIRRIGDEERSQIAPLAKIEDDGRFSASGVPAGRAYFRPAYWSMRPWRLLRVECNGADARDGIDIAAGQKITGVRIVYAEGKGTIRGQVQLSGGALPENAEVMIHAEPANQYNAPENSHGYRNPNETGGEARADTKGRFVIEDLLSGEYGLRLEIVLQVNNRMRIPLYYSNKPEQRVTVTNDAESSTTINFDLSKIKREGQQ